MDLSQRTLEALDWPYVLGALASHARTAAGRRAALELDLFDELAAIHRTLDAVGEALGLLTSEGAFPPTGGVEDIAGLVARSERGELLEAGELRPVASTVAALVGLRGFLDVRRQSAPTLASTGDAIDIDRALLSTLTSAFDERGELSERAYPVLGELRRRIQALDRRVRERMDALLVDEEFAGVLQDRYVTIRAERFVVPIKAHAKGLDLGIVHDASRSGQTIFLEPHAVVPLNNQRRVAEAELRAEELRILRDLSALVGRHAPALVAALAAAAAIDLIVARAELALRMHAARPEVADQAIVDLRAARHPVLVLERAEVVANDLRLTAEQPVLVLTGPNAGGKTVALKTIGICALLVRAGCFVPAAEGSRVDLFEPVLADIGDRQSVYGGLSSFSGHLANLHGMLAEVRPGALLLLDEIAAGTDPAQGGALARALVERFAEAGARVVVTTHYAQLKAMSAADRRVSVAAMEYRDERPTYRILPGLAGESHALAAALRAGIEPAVVTRARALMDQGERALQETLASLEAERTRARETRLQAERALEEVAGREAAVAEREAHIRRRARQLEQEAAAALVERARQAEREIGAIVADLQRAPSAAAAAAARSAVRHTRDSVMVGPTESEDRAAPSPQPGDRVRIEHLNLTGEVVAVRGREVEVRAAALSVRVAPNQLRKLEPDAPDRLARPPSRSSSQPARSTAINRIVRHAANTLDLRGTRVEEALVRLERFLDEAMLAGHDGVFVLHGHGTDALKRAVRAALDGSPYVAAFGPADSEQGGDAWTAVVLRG